jgi:precorrin-2 dehydrogenase/sirohydrochlorin ferrochelatase
MIPVMLDPTRLRIGLAGRGALAVRRLDWFQALGVTPELYSDAPEPDFAKAAGDRLVPRLPDTGDLAALDFLWIADLDTAAEALFDLAKDAKVMVNVEDVLPYCDFHTPAVLKRGRLLIAAGTGGTSPAVAGAVRRKLDDCFPEQWGDALEDIARARNELRAAGATMSEVAADARRRLAAAGLI